MRIRGRRVVLLIAGALPLVAEENAERIGHATTSPPSSIEPHRYDDNDDDTVRRLLTTDKATKSGIRDTFQEIDNDTEPNQIPQHLLLPTEEKDGDDVVWEEDATSSDEPHKRLTTLSDDTAIDNDASTFRALPLDGTEEMPKLEAEDVERLQSIRNDERIVEGEPPVRAETIHKRTEEALGTISDNNKTIVGDEKDHASIQVTPPEKTKDYLQSKETSNEEREVVDEQSDKNANELFEKADKSNTNGHEREDSSDNGTEKKDEEDDEDSLSRVSVDYASKSAGALIIEKSKDFKGTSNLLNSDRDRYAIAPCEEKKFVVMSLSEDILVKQIKLANYERFSSSVKDFQVLGSQTLGKWFDLGTFTAKPGNGEQTFDLAEPAWVRYLKFKFLSHHGVEYYCTYSQIQVHGSTMVQGFHEQWEDTKGEEDNELTIDDIHVGLLSDDGAVNATVTNAMTLESQVEAPPEVSKESSTVPSICTLSFSQELDNKLSGIQALSDEELVSSLYDIIPSTLGCLPKESRKSLGRRTTGGQLKTIHQLGMSSRQSIYGMSSKKTSAISKAEVTSESHTIVAPRMTDQRASTLVHSLSTELGRMLARWSHLGAIAELTTEDASANPRFIVGTVLETKTKESEQGSTAERVQETLKDDVDPAKVASQPSGAEDTTMGVLQDERTAETHQDSTQETSYDPALIEQSLAKLLENLPSAECLSKLDFAQFKLKAAAARKANGASGATASSSSTSMEPIFKKLTDEIKHLQASLSVHDQFTKVSVACYQRIMTDLILEMEKLRTNHEHRLLKLEKELLASRGPSLWKIIRFYFAILHTLLLWVYTTIVYIFTPLLVWLVSIAKGGLPGRRILSAWGSVKAHLLHNEDGSLSGVARYLGSIAAQVDLLAAMMGHRESNVTVKEGELLLKENEEIWRFPVVPIVLLVLIGRLWMCCNAQSGKRLKLPSNSELRAWKEQVAAPAKTPSPAQRRHGKPRAYSVGAHPSQDPPHLASEPTINSTQFSGAQQTEPSKAVLTAQLSEKPVVSPVTSPSTAIHQPVSDK